MLVDFLPVYIAKQLGTVCAEWQVLGSGCISRKWITVKTKNVTMLDAMFFPLLSYFSLHFACEQDWLLMFPPCLWSENSLSFDLRFDSLNPFCFPVEKAIYFALLTSYKNEIKSKFHNMKDTKSAEAIPNTLYWRLLLTWMFILGADAVAKPHIDNHLKGSENSEGTLSENDAESEAVDEQSSSKGYKLPFEHVYINFLG